VRQRLAPLAGSVRPLSGVRRGCFVALLLVALLAGQVPYRLSAIEAGLTLVFLVATSTGLTIATGGALRPGDRCRFSVRTVGASWRGLVSPDGRSIDPRRSLTAHGHHEAASLLALGVLGIALGMRGFSDRLTHTVHPFAGRAELSLLVVALWLLAVGLHSQRLLPRAGRRRRRATRVGAPIEGEVSVVDAAAAAVLPAHLVDLTVLGSSVVLPRHVAEQMTSRDVLLQFRLAEASGRSRRVSNRCAARHGRVVAPSATDALGPGRIGPRAAALVAVAGVVASVGPFGAHGGGGGGLVVACAALILGAIVAAGSLPQRHDDVLDQEWLALAAVPVPTVLSQPVAPPAHVQSSSPDFAMR